MKIFNIGDDVVCLDDRVKAKSGTIGICIEGTNKFNCVHVLWNNGQTDMVDGEYLKLLKYEALYPASDNINPSHYKQGDIECIDAIKSATMELNGFDGMCTGNAIKYLWRWKQKNGIEDLKKAKWYIDKLIGEQKEVEK